MCATCVFFFILFLFSFLILGVLLLVLSCIPTVNVIIIDESTKVPTQMIAEIQFLLKWAVEAKKMFVN